MRFIATAAAILFALPASANEFTPALEAYLNTEISGWANGPEIVAAIKAQNAANAGLDQARIDELDKTWRADVGNPSSPLIAPVLTGPVADSLRARPIFTETSPFFLGIGGVHASRLCFSF